MATIKGVWKFKDEVSPAPPAGTATSQNISFTSNGINYSLINLVLEEDFGTPVLYYGNTIVFDLMGRSADFEGWLNDGYRTVDFGTTEQTVSDTFYAFMNASATQQTEPTPTVTVEYNGETIAELQAGQQATILCKGDNVKMHTDIVVTAPEEMGGSVEEWDGSIEVV